MALRDRLMAGTAPFAHLMPVLRRARGEDNEDDRREDDENTARAEDGDEDEDDEAKASAARAEETDEGDTEGDDEDDEDRPKDDSGKGKRGQRARAEEKDGDARPDEDEEDDDEEMSNAKAAGFGKALRASRRLERRRCARIFLSPHAGGRVAQAAHLAFNTGLSSAQAIALLQTMPKGGALAASASRGSALERAMRGHRPSTGPGGQSAPVSPLAAAMQREVKAINDRKARGL